MLVLNFLCEEHTIFYHTSLLQVFQLSFFKVKWVNHFEDHVTYQDIEHQLQNNILYHFLCYIFL